MIKVLTGFIIMLVLTIVGVESFASAGQKAIKPRVVMITFDESDTHKGVFDHLTLEQKAEGGALVAKAHHAIQQQNEIGDSIPVDF